MKATLLFLMLYASSLLSYAQTEILAKKDSVNLNEVIISVNKTEETKRDVAQQVTLINSDQIERQEAQTTADLIASSGSVFVQKSQAGGGSPVIRGFEANRILLVIDGVRMNNIIYRAGHLQNILTVDNSILDRAEILYGPSSTIYGSDALGGVIHLYTRKPEFSFNDTINFGVNAFTRFGTANDEKTGHVDVNVGGKSFASLTSFTYSDFGDVRGGENQNPYFTSSFGERKFYAERINGKDSLVKNSDRFLQIGSAYNQYDILQKFSIKHGSKMVHGLNLQYSNSSDVPRYDRLTDPDGTGLRYSEWYYGPQKRMLAAYDFNMDNEGHPIKYIHLGANYQDIEESRVTRRFNRPGLQSRIEKVKVIGVNADFRMQSVSHRIQFGADAQYNTLNSTATEKNIETGEVKPLDTRYPDGDNSMMSAALYFSHSWKINEQFSLTDGIRLGITSLKSTFDDTSFFHLPYSKAEQSNVVYSGSLGIIHTPSDALKFSMLVSTGFRVPNVDDLSKVFESAAGSLIVPNKDLKPEKTINTEIGVTGIFNGRTSWENTVFYTQFFDAIVTDVYQYNGQDSILYDGSMSRVYANQNKGRAYIYGYSSDLKLKCTSDLEFDLVAVYTYGRIKTDSSDYPLDHIPPFMMKLKMEYNINNFGFDFSIHYNGWKRLKDYNRGGEDNEQYATAEGMPAWYTLNMRASYKLSKMLTLRAGVDNIFDTQYRTFASGINAAGRNVFGSLHFRYN